MVDHEPAPSPLWRHRLERLSLVFLLTLACWTAWSQIDLDKAAVLGYLATWWSGFHYDIQHSWTPPADAPTLHATILRFVLDAFLQTCLVYLWFGGLGLPGRLRRIPYLGKLGLGLANLAIVVAFLALVEGPFRHLEASNPQFMMPHLRLSNQLVPLVTYPAGSAEPFLITDGSGFRSEERSYRKPPGTCRVFLLGDSALFGIGIPQSKSVGPLLERLLRAWRPDRRFEVFNASIPRTSCDEGLWILQRRILPRAPDLVLVGYNNDGNENISDPARPASGPAVVLLDALVLRSAFVRVTVFALAMDRERADKSVKAPASSRAHFEPEPARNRWLRRLGITPVADYLPPTPDRVREVYRRMAEVARQNGFQLAVVSMPESLQPGETYRRLPPAYRAAQRAAALQAGVPLVDMNRSFGGEMSLFTDDRYHLSHAGEVRLAQGFFEFIKSRGCP